MLLTDLYELTMARAYHELGMQETAVFELFVRRLPPTRRFLIAAGLEQVVEYLEAQLVESRIVNPAHFQTVIASKAVRCVSAARKPGREPSRSSVSAMLAEYSGATRLPWPPKSGPESRYCGRSCVRGAALHDFPRSPRSAPSADSRSPRYPPPSEA